VSVLSARDLSKSYGPRTLFSGLSLAIQPGEHVGLLGRNGAGKSSLLRVLAGLEPPDGGTLERKRGASVALLSQTPVLPPDATPRAIAEAGLAGWHAARARHGEVTALLAEDGLGQGRLERGANEHEDGHAALLAEQAQLAETIERLGGWDKGHRAVEMLERFGVREIDRAVSGMSGGEQRRVALAALLISEPDLAILDEPTNHLDLETIEYLEDYLAERFAGAVLLVTHDRYVLDAVAERVLELEHGTLREFAGSYSDYLEHKSELLAQEQRTESNRQNRLRRERAWLLRGAKARTTKQKARIKRAEALMAVEAPRVDARAELAGLQAGAAQSGKTILELAGVTVELGGRTLIDKLDLHMVPGERMGVLGPNGAGKTTLLKLITGELLPTRGSVRLGTRTQVAYFDQARIELHDDWSVFDNVAGRHGAERDGGGEVKIGALSLTMRQYLERFLFDGSKQRQPLASLSGGERARVSLAKALRGGANMLLLDEPTNDLDFATLGELEDLLGSWPGCAVVVSHDRAFLNLVATTLLVFEGDGAVVRYQGNYDTYRRLREAARERKDPGAGAGAGAGAGVGASADAGAGAGVGVGAGHDKPLSYAERIELDGIFDRIAAAETKLAELDTALADPATYKQGPDAQRATQIAADEARSEVNRLTARWEALEARNRKKS
jgi:ABC transport system ATP-binding/permease protein